VVLLAHGVDDDQDHSDEIDLHVRE